MKRTQRIAALVAAVLVCSAGAVLGAAAAYGGGPASSVPGGADQGPGVSVDFGGSEGPATDGVDPFSSGPLLDDIVAAQGDLVGTVEIADPNGLPAVADHGPKVTDGVTDGDGDGLYDYLVVEVRFDAPALGIYELQGVVFSHDDCCFIAAETVAAELDSGRQTISLSFFGYLIRESGLDGPYTVHLFLLGPEASSSEGIDHMTRAYTHDQFEAYSDSYPPKELWVDSVSVQILTGEPSIEGEVSVTIKVGPNRLTPIVEGDLYILIAYADSDIPEGIVWDGGAGFTIFEGQDSITLTFEFSLTEHGSYVAGAYLTSIENPEVVTCAFEA